MTTTIADIMRDTAERGMADLLIAVADYFYCLGAGVIPPPSTVAGRADLLATLECIHRLSVLSPRGWEEPRLRRDEIPGWLLRMQRQNETPEGWGVDGWPI